jgi:thiamine biosynthesis protein ThiI
VGLKNPDLTISVDLAGDRVFIYGNKIHGPGGLPLSSQWKMLAVLDSGPLTILAAFAMMRRGCMVELLIPLSERIAQFKRERQLALATKLRSLVTRSAYKAFSIQVDSLGGQRIDDCIDARKLIRGMAVQIAKKKKCRGIILPDITGNLDTLQMETITPNDGNTALPIFHPLIGLDLKDLIELCKVAGLSEDDLLSQISSERRNGEYKEIVMPVESSDELPVEEIAL